MKRQNVSKIKLQRTKPNLIERSFQSSESNIDDVLEIDLASKINMRMNQSSVKVIGNGKVNFSSSLSLISLARLLSLINIFKHKKNIEIEK